MTNPLKITLLCCVTCLIIAGMLKPSRYVVIDWKAPILLDNQTGKTWSFGVLDNGPLGGWVPLLK